MPLAVAFDGQQRMRVVPTGRTDGPFDDHGCGRIEERPHGVMRLCRHANGQTQHDDEFKPCAEIDYYTGSAVHRINADFDTVRPGRLEKTRSSAGPTYLLAMRGLVVLRK